MNTTFKNRNQSKHEIWEKSGLHLLFLVLPLVLATSARATLRGGDVDPTFNPGSTASEAISSIAVQPDGKVLVGGYFYYGTGAARNGIARLNADGSLDTSFQEGMDGVGAGDYVSSIALKSDGKMLIGGYFNGVNGANRHSIARLNADGSVDTGFQNGMAGAIYQICNSVYCDSYLGWINSVAVQSDGRVVVVGHFTHFNSVFRNSIARLNPDGSLDTSFQEQQGWYGQDTPTVYSVAIQADGKVISGGSFGIARRNADGRLDTNFMAVANSAVRSIVLQPDGKALIGGYFSTVNGTNHNRIARLNANGSLDAGFQSGLSGSDDYVFSIALHSNGKVLIGGRFTAVNGVSRTNLARLNVDGSLDPSFQNGMVGADSEVLAVAPQGDGKVLVGGEFLTVNGAARPYLARLYGTAPLLLSKADVVSNRYGFNITGESNAVAVVEVSTNFADWTPLSTNTIGAGPVSFRDPSPASFPKRFYRARAL